MKSDGDFAELRKDTGSPVAVRVPFGIMGLLVNLQFFVWKEDVPPNWYILLLATGLCVLSPIFLVKMASGQSKRGLFYGWKHPIVYLRWAWWLMVWPASDEPLWRKRLALALVTVVTLLVILGRLRWGGLTPGG